MTNIKEKNLKEIEEDTKALSCVIQKGLLFLEEFLDGPMCARCLPCPMGSYEMKIRLQKLSTGSGSFDDIELIRKIAYDMFDTSMCKKGKDTAKFIADTLKNTPDTYEAHVLGSCPDRECTSLFFYKVISDKCLMCGDCKKVCKDFAILGEKKEHWLVGFLPFEIIEKRCTRCGECIKACEYGAIEVVDMKVPEAVEA